MGLFKQVAVREIHGDKRIVGHYLHNHTCPSIADSETVTLHSNNPLYQGVETCGMCH